MSNDITKDKSEPLKIDEELQKKIDVLMLKRDLIAEERDLLEKQSDNPDGYGKFIRTLRKLVSEEPGFFLLSDALIEISDAVMQKRRFDFSSISDYGQVINDIIGAFNKLRAMSIKEQEENVNIYIQDNFTKRRIDEVENDDAILFILAADAHVIECLQAGSLESVPFEFLMSSTNYFLTEMPELYQDNPSAIASTIAQIDTATEQSGIFTGLFPSPQLKRAKETKKDIAQLVKS